MKARLEGEDWTGLDEALKEFSRLTPRDKFAQQLTQLKDDAAHRQAELKTAVLTKTAQAQITELQSMIDRYMEDDAFRAYSDAACQDPIRDGRQDEGRGKEGSDRGLGSTERGDEKGTTGAGRALRSRCPLPRKPSRLRRQSLRKRRFEEVCAKRNSTQCCAIVRIWPTVVRSDVNCEANMTRFDSHDQEIEPAPASAFSWSLVIFDLECLPLPKTFARSDPPRKRRSKGWGRKVVDMAVPGRDHPGELEHLFQLVTGVLLARSAHFCLFDAVLQKGDGGVHLAALAFGHDDTKGFHDVFQSLEPVASVADDVDTPNDAPGDQLAQAGRDVGSAHVEQRADFFGIEWRRGDKQERMYLGHRAVDAPGLAHLAPVKHELLCGWCECHVDSALSGQTVSTEIILARGVNDKSAADSLRGESMTQNQKRNLAAQALTDGRMAKTAETFASDSRLCIRF